MPPFAAASPRADGDADGDILFFFFFLSLSLSLSLSLFFSIFNGSLFIGGQLMEFPVRWFFSLTRRTPGIIG